MNDGSNLVLARGVAKVGHALKKHKVGHDVIIVMGFGILPCPTSILRFYPAKAINVPMRLILLISTIHNDVEL